MPSKNTLRTLKDITCYYDSCDGCIATRDELKAEAVKWYKNLNNIDEGDWRKFFNLTEEELR